MWLLVENEIGNWNSVTYYYTCDFVDFHCALWIQFWILWTVSVIFLIFELNRILLQAYSILSLVRVQAWRKWRVLDRMIGFISASVTISLNYNQYSAVADLHTFQFTVAHALEFSVFTSRLLATDLNTETVTSSIMKSSCYFLFKYSVLLCPNLYLVFTIH
jgi:hypothetical protein